MAEGRAPDIQKAKNFFIDGPPGCDPAHSHRLGLFHGGWLSGLAVLSVNVRGRAFWEREGFQAMGLSGLISAGKLEMEAHRLRKPLLPLGMSNMPLRRATLGQRVPLVYTVPIGFRAKLSLAGGFIGALQR